MEEVKIHDRLNEKLWDWSREKRIGGKTYYRLKPEVLEKLKEIANAFIQFLEIPTEAVKDIFLLGSSANFNYTKYSDIDLHLSVDFDKIHKDCPVVQGYLWAQKSLFNKEHDITIYGIPVELYAESTEEQTQSNGIFSIMHNKWVKEPTREVPDVNDTAIRAKYAEVRSAIEDTNAKAEAEEILEKVYKMRKAGLEKNGEFSVENAVFKKLRNDGLLQKLKEQVKNSFDKALSLQENLSKYLAHSSFISFLSE